MQSRTLRRCGRARSVIPAVASLSLSATQTGALHFDSNSTSSELSSKPGRVFAELCFSVRSCLSLTISFWSYGGLPDSGAPRGKNTLLYPLSKRRAEKNSAEQLKLQKKREGKKKEECVGRDRRGNVKE